MGDWQIASPNHSIGVLDSFTFVEGDTGLIKARMNGALDNNGRPYAIFAQRQAFRSWMVQNLDVKAGKRLLRYEDDNDGVTAYFTDGTSTRGSILVGADGASSVVRKQLVDNSEAELHQFVPICGEVTLTGELLDKVRGIASSALIAHGSKAHLGLSQVNIAADGNEGRYWYLVAFKSDNPVADTAWVCDATREALYQKTLEVTKESPKIFSDIVQLGGAAGVWSPQIRFSEYVSPTELPRGRVTLIGDAAHNTTPFGGMGANVSILDACDLGKLLVNEKWETYDEAADLLSKHEHVMLPRGRNLVLSSRARGTAHADGHQVSQIVERRGKMVPVIPPIQLDMPALTATQATATAH